MIFHFVCVFIAKPPVFKGGTVNFSLFVTIIFNFSYKKTDYAFLHNLLFEGVS